MKNKQNAMSGLKYLLRKRKKEGEKVAILKLNSDQRAYVENLGYEVRPYMFKVQTRTFTWDIRRNDRLLKRIHFAAIKGFRCLYLKQLTAEDLKVLQDCGLSAYRLKDEVILNP